MNPIIVIGTSYGGLSALQKVLANLPQEFVAPVVIVQHRTRDQDLDLRSFLQKRCPLPLREPEDKEAIAPGIVYLAPRDYHLLIERGGFALSMDAPISYARPSIDVLFESAAEAYGSRLIGVIMTGANADGANGLAKIKQRGGICIVQEPESAEARQMPDAALAKFAESSYEVDYILPLTAIPQRLFELCDKPEATLTNMMG